MYIYIYIYRYRERERERERVRERDHTISSRGETVTSSKRCIVHFHHRNFERPSAQTCNEWVVPEQGMSLFVPVHSREHLFQGIPHKSQDLACVHCANGRCAEMCVRVPCHVTISLVI